jgi:hypothetical protein
MISLDATAANQDAEVVRSYSSANSRFAPGGEEVACARVALPLPRCAERIDVPWASDAWCRRRCCCVNSRRRVAGTGG